MKLSVALLSIVTIIPISATTSDDFATPCYGTTLPSLSPSNANRTTPWGSPSFSLPNGTLCCSSLAQIRSGIDEVDAQLLSLLAQRAAYVREATRFKATLDTVDVPSRDQEVVDEAVDMANTTTPPLPRTIAKTVFEAVLNASVGFEECVFEEFGTY
ncbi:hypothetical protein B7494_g1603 [Chlorociboria aeruginascens]|nr:hypothetical protein B7494_g1603 [Chlorociboria aeruginascens]